MICPNCETEFQEKNAKFCTECGTPLVRNRAMNGIPIKSHKKRDISSASKIDVIIEQNERIIELLEEILDSN